MTDLSAPLLVTKLHIPTIRSRWVERHHLLERLMSQPDAGLVLLSAPPGYGKTSLLTEWSRLLADQAVQVAWLSLEENDNDPLRFWTYAISAFQSLPGCGCERLGENLLSLLRLPEPPPLTNLLALLINELSTLNAQVVLILDDYHTITDPEIHTSLAFLLNHLPTQLRVVIASRSTPHLPLPRLRARGKILELHAEDLRFSPEESAQFLQHVMGLDLSSEDASALEQRTEGWAAGLQLAALSFHGAFASASAPAQRFGGDDRYVLDYLTEEVLSQQPPEIQDFLLKTSLLPRFSAALCDAVLQNPSASDALLERLDAANLFIVPLDNQRRWYRYHHLFADLLRHQLERQSPEQIPELHQRAALWFEAQGLIDEAIQHAIVADMDLTVRLIEKHYSALVAHFEIGPMLQWLGFLPQERVLASPALCLAWAWIHLFHIRNERCDEWLEKADAAMSAVTDADELRSLRGQAAAIRSTVAIGRSEHKLALEYAREALDNLTPDVMLMRALIHLNIGDAYMGEDFEVSAHALNEAIHLSRELSNPGFTMICAGSLVNLYLINGRLHEAAQAYSNAREMEDQWIAQGGKALPETGKILGNYAQILYQWNDLEGAHAAASESVLRCEEWGHNDHILDARLILARIKQALGRPDEANAVLAQARISLEKYIKRVQGSSSLAREKKLQRGIEAVASQEAFIALQQNRLDAVERWATTKGLDEIRAAHAYAGEQVLFAWLLLRRGENAAAVPLLESAIAGFEKIGYSIHATRALALLACALAQQESAQPERALNTLARAVALAAPENYLAAFLEVGAPLTGLLEQLSHRLDASPELHAYMSRLSAALTAAHPDTQPSSSPTPRLVEPLTERELDVLRQLALGSSNNDIAAALYLSVNTVKTHVKHMYEKLDAANRVELVEKSRRLGLL